MLFVASLPNTCTVKVPFPALAAPPLPCYCALLVVTRSTATKQSTQHPEACIQTVHQTFPALFTFNVLAQKQHLDTRFNCSQWEKQKKISPSIDFQSSSKENSQQHCIPRSSSRSRWQCSAVDPELQYRPLGHPYPESRENMFTDQLY